ncbi:MAG: CHRD domain-containing protein [Thermoanaerobaculia bacterium]
MKKLLIYTLAVAMATFIGSTASAEISGCGANNGTSFSATLAGRQFGSPLGMLNGSGVANVRLDTANHVLFADLSTAGLTGVTGVSIIGPNGNVVFDLTGSQSIDQGGNFTLAQTIPDSLMNDIIANPGQYSIRIDTTANPNGAIQGALVDNRVLLVNATGANVIGTPGSTSATGTAILRIQRDANGTPTLYVDFLGTPDLSSISQLQLRQAAPGMNGPVVMTLGSDLTPTDNRLTLSVPITDTLANEILSNPSDYYLTANTAAFPNGAVRAQLGLGNEVVIPAVGSLPGALGSHWDTNIQIYNASATTDTPVYIEFFPRGAMADATFAGMTAVETVPARGTLAFTQLSQLLPNAQGMGALRIISDGNVAATARIFNDQGNLNLGTFGQSMPGLNRCDSSSAGLLTGLTDVGTSGTGLLNTRANVGFFNASPVAVAVNMVLHSATGTDVGNRTLTLGPWEQMQTPLIGATGLFNTAADLESGTLSYSASAPIYVYGSVVDNASGDPTTILPTPDLSAAF